VGEGGGLSGVGVSQRKQKNAQKTNSGKEVWSFLGQGKNLAMGGKAKRNTVL